MPLTKFVERVLILGDSHCLFLARALGNTPAKDLSNSIQAYLAPDQTERAIYIPAHRKSNFFIETQNRWEINSDYEKILTTFAESKTICFVSLHGNDHNARFLKQNKVAFDFYHNRVPFFQVGRQIVPYSCIKRQLQDSINQLRRKLRSLKHFFPAQLLKGFAPPPPVRNFTDILEKPEVFDFSGREVENQWVRLKVYLSYCDLLAKEYQSLGIDFLDAPNCTMDSNGFILPKFQHGATHASPNYYSKVLTSHELVSYIP